MGLWEFYQPATAAAPILKTWLDEVEAVTPSQLRRLTLVALMHWFDLVRYHGLNFTTIFSKEIGLSYGFSLLFPFTVYNALSNNQPIRSVEEYSEQIGGFPPHQIDPVRYFVNYVTGNQKLRIILEVEKSMYEFGEPVCVSLTVRNLTNRSIILENKEGPTVRFTTKSMLKGENEQLAKSTTDSDEESNQLTLPPNAPITIEWTTNLSKRSNYPIEAQVYIPHYDKVIDLLVSVGHGTEPRALLTKNLCTL